MHHRKKALGERCCLRLEELRDRVIATAGSASASTLIDFTALVSNVFACGTACSAARLTASSSAQAHRPCSINLSALRARCSCHAGILTWDWPRTRRFCRGSPSAAAAPLSSAVFQSRRRIASGSVDRVTALQARAYGASDAATSAKNADRLARKLPTVEFPVRFCAEFAKQ